MTAKKTAKTKKRAAPASKPEPAQDVLTQYLRDISDIQPLSREEEYEISERIKQGDAQALQELVCRNLKYVVTVANSFKGCGLAFQDLIEEGNIGLIEAAKRFDGKRQVKFITYAVWWIRQSIMHSLAEQSGTVRLPIKQVSKVFKLDKKQKLLTQVLEREPTQSELAEGMGIKESEIETLMRAFRTYVSLDTPIKMDQETPYVDLLENPDYESFDDQIIKQKVSQQVDEMLHDLTPREEQILRMRFGFNGEVKTLEEIGKEIGLSRERVRQIEKRAKERLKMKLQPSTPEDE